MIEIKKGSLAKVGVPPAFQERCVVRITDSKCGENKKGNQMITLQSEMVGYVDSNNVLHTSIKRGDITYKLAGLKLQPTWFTLTEENIAYYAEFYAAANPGEELTVLDEMNPALEYTEGLLMQAIVNGRSEPFRKALTAEEKAAKIEAGEKNPVGDPILDEEGKTIETARLNVNRWLKKYFGEIPEDVETETAA